MTNIEKNITLNIDKLIEWCKKTGKSISDIPTTINGEANPLYTAIRYLRTHRAAIDLSDIEVLDKYNMSWGNIKFKNSASNMISELVAWCDKYDLTIPDIEKKAKGDKARLLDLVSQLKACKSMLTRSEIARLNSYGMPWNKSALSLEDRIRQELIPWCKANNCTIDKVPTRINGVPNPMSAFVNQIRYKRDKLSHEIVALLDKYGMVWEIALVKQSLLRKKLEDKITKILIPYCESTGTKISDIPASKDGKVNPLYSLAYSISKKKSILPDELIELLDRHGMQWSYSRKDLSQASGSEQASNGTCIVKFIDRSESESRKELKEVFDKLIGYMDKKMIYVRHIRPRNRYYKYVVYIREHYDQLLDSERELFDQYVNDPYSEYCRSDKKS